MNEISVTASAILAMNQSRIQEQISMMILKANARAEQAMTNMLMQNARQIQTLSAKSSQGFIDLFA